MSNIILSVDHLTKEFDVDLEKFRDFFKWPRKKFKAVNDVSFKVKKGEILGFLGPNGAGKTTTINMLLGLIKPTKGQIKVFDLDLADNREEILSRINFSSAYNELPWLLTGRENLLVYAKLYNIKNPEAKIKELLATFDLVKLANVQRAKYSAGQNARLNLAKAFINSPELVLLDEPTASLDPDIADKVRQYLILMKDKFKTTVLFTSHNMSEVEELCDRVVFINHGKIVAEDTPRGLAKRIKDCQVHLMIDKGFNKIKKFCGENNWPQKMEGRYVDITLNEEDVALLLIGLAERGIKYSEISINKPTLEDYFLKEARQKYEMA